MRRIVAEGSPEEVQLTKSHSQGMLQMLCLNAKITKEQGRKDS